MLNFSTIGFPKTGTGGKRTANEDLYPNQAVLITKPKPEEGKWVRIFTLSNYAYEQLFGNLEKPKVNAGQVVGVDDNYNGVYIVNATNTEGVGSPVSKSCTFTNRNLMSVLMEEFQIDPTEEHVFSLEITEDSTGVKGAKIIPYQEPTDETTTDETNIDTNSITTSDSIPDTEDVLDVPEPPDNVMVPETSVVEEW